MKHFDMRPIGFKKRRGPLHQRSYLLRRERYGRYSLFDTAGAPLARFNVRRFLSGWQLRTDGRFSPEILCGLVLLCKYLEWENE